MCVFLWKFNKCTARTVLLDVFGASALLPKDSLCIYQVEDSLCRTLCKTCIEVYSLSLYRHKVSDI